MNDVNYDEFEPVGQTSGGTYSTARPTRKRNVGLAIAVSLLAVIACAAAALVSLFSIRIERNAGSTSLVFTERNLDISAVQPPAETTAAPPETAVPGDEPTVQIRPHEGEAMELSEVYRKLQPSVVSVVSSTINSTSSYVNTSMERCGVIMSDDGYIITSYRAIRDSVAITVLMSDGSEYVGVMVGGDLLSDLAVIKIDAEGLTSAEFGEPDQLAVGDRVLSIAGPTGRKLDGAMTDGIISCINRDVDVDGRTVTFLQTNACLPSGGYGGPLINLRGQVVGINTECLGASVRSNNQLGLTIPIDNVKRIVDELIEHGYIPGPPSLGLTGQSVTVAAQTFFQLPAGVYVEAVDTNGAAEQAGITRGDVITAVEDVPVSSLEEMNLIKNRYKSGDTISLTVLRNGEESKVSLTLGEIQR